LKIFPKIYENVFRNALILNDLALLESLEGGDASCDWLHGFYCEPRTVYINSGGTIPSRTGNDLR
jgi:hypothetical protein